METHFQHLLGVLNEAGRSDGPVDMFSLLLKASTDIATEAVLGRSTHSLLFSPKEEGRQPDEQSAAEFFQAADHATHMLGQRGLLLNMYWMIDSFSFRTACRTCKSFVNRHLDEARGLKREPLSAKPGNEEAASFMHSLVIKDEAPPEVIRDQLLALLLASRDTSASFAAWTIYALARDRRVLEKLGGLIRTRLPFGQIPTMEDVAALPYLRHVLNEALRVYPVVPLDARTAKCDTVLPEGGGSDGQSPMLVPAGAKVGFNIYALHHRRDIFGEDADEFRPERWEYERGGVGSLGAIEGAFVPFIIGPRVCLGSKW